MIKPDPDSLRSIAGYWRANVVTGDNRGFTSIVTDGASTVARAVQECLDSLAKTSAKEREEFLSMEIYEQLKAVSDLLWSTVSEGAFRPERLGRMQSEQVVVYGMANIAILEAYGLLIPDEYNGIQYNYEMSA
jgi:hypothetical protein